MIMPNGQILDFSPYRIEISAPDLSSRVTAGLPVLTAEESSRFINVHGKTLLSDTDEIAKKYEKKTVVKKDNPF